MAIHADAHLAKALQKTSLESPFQVGDSQIKAIRWLANIFDSETKIPNMDKLPTPLAPLMKKSSKLPKVEYKTAPPPRVDPDEESKDREQKPTIPI